MPISLGSRAFDIFEVLVQSVGETRAPRIKSAQGVNRRPIWRCSYPDRSIPRSGRTRRWRPYASIGSDS